MKRYVYANKYRIVGILITLLTIALLWFIESQSVKQFTLSIEYAPYGTEQSKAQLIYWENGEKVTITENVENFKVNFLIPEKLISIEKLQIIPGNQSGTVQIKGITIQSGEKQLNISDKEIEDYFEITGVFEQEIEQDWLEIFSYDIGASRLDADISTLKKETVETKTPVWFTVLVAAVICWIIIIVVQKYKNRLLHGIVIIFLKCGKICRRILKGIRELGVEKLIIFSIISIFGCMALSDFVSDFIFNYIVRYEEILVDNVYLLNEDSDNFAKIWDNRYIDEENEITENLISEKRYGYFDFKQLQKSIVESNKIEIGTDKENSYGYIELNDPNSYVVFDLPVYPNTCLTLSVENNKYAVRVKNEENGYERIVAYENTTTANSVKIYLFDIIDYAYIFVAYVCIYMVLFIVIFYILCVLSRSSANYIEKGNDKYKTIKICGFIFLTYVLFTGLTYYFNAEKFQVGEETDAYYYMNPVLFDEEGKFSLKAISDYLYSFRGYFSIL